MRSYVSALIRGGNTSVKEKVGLSVGGGGVVYAGISHRR